MKYGSKLCGFVKLAKNCKDIYESFKEDGFTFGENTQNVVKEKLIETGVGVVMSNIPFGGLADDCVSEKAKNLCGIKHKKKEEKKEENK